MRKTIPIIHFHDAEMEASVSIQYVHVQITGRCYNRRIKTNKKKVQKQFLVSPKTTAA